MNTESVHSVAFNENNFSKGTKPQQIFRGVLKYLPKEMIPNITMLVQSSGYITIKPVDLSRRDWSKLNVIVKKIGGIWISNDRFSHWSIPLSLID